MRWRELVEICGGQLNLEAQGSYKFDYSAVTTEFGILVE